MEPLLISEAEAAQMLGLGASKFREVVDSGAINRIRLGRRVLYSVEKLQAYVAALGKVKTE